MNVSGVVNAGLVALVIVAWVLPNDREVAAATRPDAGFPWRAAVWAAISALLLLGSLRRRDWLSVVMDVTVFAMCARVLWHWWRRKRKGRQLLASERA